MRKTLYIIVVLIGLMQIIGYLTGVKAIRNLGIISASSPLPIVFTEVNGVETFASDFYLQWTSAQGVVEDVKITPEIYARLKGPYNRRNIYGAAIAYGPVLPESIWSPVLSYGLCKDVLAKELQLPVTKSNFSVQIKTRTLGRDNIWALSVNCK